jgi:hypothetical protein
MQCKLLMGIYKHAFISPSGFSGRNRQFAPWGGTTADVGHASSTSLPVSIGAWSLGSKLGKGIGLTGKGVTAMGGLVGGAGETLYGLTRGVSQAKKKGAQFGDRLGRTNRFLAARL